MLILYQIFVAKICLNTISCIYFLCLVLFQFIFYAGNSFSLILIFSLFYRHFLCFFCFYFKMTELLLRSMSFCNGFLVNTFLSHCQCKRVIVRVRKKLQNIFSVIVRASCFSFKKSLERLSKRSVGIRNKL